jgi:hypothetical protein
LFPFQDCRTLNKKATKSHLFMALPVISPS